MSSSSVTTQWQRLCLHCGDWYGSFARLDAMGQGLGETPSQVTLSEAEAEASFASEISPTHNSPIHQTVAFGDETGQWQPARAMTYRSLTRGILFFDNGAYSQGSLQASPIAEFGAEFGFVRGDRRLRAVVQYEPSAQPMPLSQITLIREHRDRPAPDARSRLTVEQLVGVWQGRSTAIYPDWYEPEAIDTWLEIKQMDDRLHQTLSFPGFERRSTATIDNQRLLFADTASAGQPAIQVLMLPDGASITAPLTLPKGRAFFLEVGWLLSPTERQRLIRHYDERGAWTHLTLVQETKVSS